jgi:phospholipid/cholesterol/gamma-HCH transport system substrate-binding protein
MDERRRDTVVGIFVLAGIAVAMVMVALLGSEQGIFRRRFQVRAVFGEVSGLRSGAPVFVAGVNVGTVQSIRFVSPREGRAPITPLEAEGEYTSRVGEVEVVMTIEEGFRPQIRRDSVATIASVGLLGDKSIEISVGSGNEPVVESGDVLQSEDPLTLTEVIDQVQPIARKVDAILTDISALTGTLTGKEAPVQRAIRSLGSILEKIDEGQGTLGELVNSRTIGDEAEATLASLDALLVEARVATADLKRALTDLPPTMASARKVADDVARLAESLRESAQRLPEITRDVASIARNVERASQSFPALAVDAQRGVRRASEVFDAAGKTIFLRGYLEEPRDRLPAALGRSDPSLAAPDPGSSGATRGE